MLVVIICANAFKSQPHSSLNMYKKADDEKSNLILTVLSWIDYIRPKFILFENVQGFLGHRLNAEQDGKYAVRGGIESGGLKFLVRTLTALGYVRLVCEYLDRLPNHTKSSSKHK